MRSRCSIGDAGVVSQLVVGPVHLHGTGSGTAAIRSNQGAVRCVDSFPIVAVSALGIQCICAVIVGQNLQFAVYRTNAASPFPYVAFQVSNAGRGLVMIPGQRTGAGQCTQRIMRIVFIARNRLVTAFGSVLAIAIIAFRQNAVVLAPAQQQAPFHTGHQMPAFAFVVAVFPGLIKIQSIAGVNTGQGICPVILNDVQEFGDINLIHFLAVHDKRFVYSRAGAHAQLGVGQLRDFNHDGRFAQVVKQYFVSGAAASHR